MVICNDKKNDVEKNDVNSNNSSGENCNDNGKVKRKVGRPVSATSKFNVTIHNIKDCSGKIKYRYLSVQKKKVINNKVTYRHYHIGSFDSNNVFHPTMDYIFSSDEFRQKLVFPSSVRKDVEIDKLMRKYVIDYKNLIMKKSEEIDVD